VPSLRAANLIWRIPVKTLARLLLGRKTYERLLHIWKSTKLSLRSSKITLKKKVFPPNPEERHLNIGGGNWYYRRWENIDLYADQVFVDYRIDLRLRAPIGLPDGCAKVIFSSHVLEHMSDESCLFILKECHRLLKPRGILRISVPDMDKALQAYTVNDTLFFDKGGVRCVGDSIERKLVNFFASYKKDNYSGGPVVAPAVVTERLGSLDKYEFVRWCVSLIPADAPYKAHVNGYDFPKLKSFLEASGFGEVVRSEHRGSSVPTMRTTAFDNRPMVSLFVEAFK